MAHPPDGAYAFVVGTSAYPLRYEGAYADGRRDGLWRVSREDTGAPQWETTWRRGMWHGPSASWWPNGARLHEGTHRDGLEDGLWRFWFEHGQLAAEGHYRAGLKDGHWGYWDQQGDAMPYAAWEVRYEHWDWAFDDMRGFPHGDNWPDPPAH